MNIAQAAAEREEAYLKSWRGFFQPVATVAELDAPRPDEHGRTQPLGIEVLGERLVVARLDGHPVAMSGTCPHRSAGLHVGWVNQRADAVTCRYHGACWRADGVLGTFPAVEIEGHPTPKWEIQTYPAVERYGLIWVCLEQQPRIPILPLPEAEDSTYVALPWATGSWEAGLGRMTEAALDTYHLAFTHVGTIGDPGDPRAPDTHVELSDGYLTYATSFEQPINPGIAGAATAADGSVSISQIVQASPNGVCLRKKSPAGNYVIYTTYGGMGPLRSRYYRLVLRDFDKDAPDEQYLDFQRRITAQDQIVIETMRPWELNTDLDAELQLYVDRPTVRYRRWLASMGLQFL